MASWNSVFGLGSIGSGSPRADGFGRPGSLRAERSGGSEAFGPEPIGPGSAETERTADREAFRWNGSTGPRFRVAGPADRKTGRWNGPRAGKPSGETVWRGAGPSGHAIQRAGTHGDGTVYRIELLSSRRFDGMGVFGSPDQRAERLKTIGSGGVRRALRSTLQGPRVQAPGVSIFLFKFQVLGGARPSGWGTSPDLVSRTT